MNYCFLLYNDVLHYVQAMELSVSRTSRTPFFTRNPCSFLEAPQHLPKITTSIGSSGFKLSLVTDGKEYGTKKPISMKVNCKYHYLLFAPLSAFYLFSPSRITCLPLLLTLTINRHCYFCLPKRVRENDFICQALEDKGELCVRTFLTFVSFVIVKSRNLFFIS